MTQTPDISGTTRAVDVLNRVAKIIQDRGETYGDAVEQNADVGRRWAKYLLDRCGVAVELDARDVCMMMVELKKSRQIYGGNNPDHVLDQIGYLAIAAAADASLDPPEQTKEFFPHGTKP